MTRRNWLLLVVLAAVLGLVAYVSLSRQAAVPPTTGPEAFKTGFVESYLKQANDAALQQSRPFNEEQKRALRQICSCAADRMLAEFSMADLTAFQANPNDPAMLARVKEFMQNCATQIKMPTSNP